MAGGNKEIKTQISSITNTKKITKAMEMVAGSKMRKTQARMLDSRPYLSSLKRVILNILNNNPEHNHSYFGHKNASPSKKIGIIMLSTDRGLCGGLNTNLFRLVLKKIIEYKKQGFDIEFSLIGNKAINFCKIYGGQVISAKSNVGDSPHLSDLIGTIVPMLKKYENQEIDEVFLAHNNFINTMTIEPEVYQLLPIDSDKLQVDNEILSGNYLYEPEAEEVLKSLMTRYVEGIIFGSVIENLASEQASRMLAMKNATDNASDMIDDLKLVYNKSRQAAITQELSEIVAGANAV